MKPSPRTISFGNKMARALWAVVWLLLFRPTPIPFHAWRRFLLRAFGAKVARGAAPYPSARIWAPWNLEMGPKSCLSHYVDCYSVDNVILEEGATVSQYSNLFTASHDYRRPDMPLIAAPIRVSKNAWVTACAFVGPGVVIGEGAIVGASSAVFRDVPARAIVAGNPAKIIKQRPSLD